MQAHATMPRIDRWSQCFLIFMNLIARWYFLQLVSFETNRCSQARWKRPCWPWRINWVTTVPESRMKGLECDTTFASMINTIQSIYADTFRRFSVFLPPEPSFIFDILLSVNIYNIYIPFDQSEDVFLNDILICMMTYIKYIQYIFIYHKYIIKMWFIQMWCAPKCRDIYVIDGSARSSHSNAFCTGRRFVDFWNEFHMFLNLRIFLFF